MNILDLFSLQGTLFALMLVGAWLRTRGIIDDNGRRCLTDLCIQIVIPCNTFKAFLIEFNMTIFQSCAMLLVGATIMQVTCLVLNRFLFNRYPPQQKKVLQYCTIVPMSSFLGNPIAEAIYDQIGVLYTAIHLIPLRIVVWSVGTSYFVADAKTDRKQMLKNILTHPCLVAVYLGMFFMLTQLTPPAVVTRTVTYIGSCTSALTMFVAGTVLPDVKLSTIFNRDTLRFSLLRLVALPAIALAVGRLLGLDSVSLGINVIMTGMPAGVTAAIFAARYGSDAPFATRCVVSSTLLSMITLPIWCWIAG